MNAEISLLRLFLPKFFLLFMASGRGATLGSFGTNRAVDYRRCPCLHCCTGFLLIAVRNDPRLLRGPGPFGIWIRRVHISGIFGAGSHNVLDGSRPPFRNENFRMNQGGINSYRFFPTFPSSTPDITNSCLELLLSETFRLC